MRLAAVTCVVALVASSCAPASGSRRAGTVSPSMSAAAPSPDPRVGLKAGLTDAGEAAWNLRLLSNTPSPGKFFGVTNSDLAFTGTYAIQGNYNGYMIWDIANPAKPVLRTSLLCPASQSDVSVYKNLLFVSGEGLTGRLDCGAQGVREAVSKERLRGLRIFDISDIANPRNVGNVQTCRGSHTHTVLEDPNDKENVYVYISGSSTVRSEEELPGCVNALPEEDPNSVRFRLEVIKVPLRNPERAAIVSSPRIFNDLMAPPEHGEAPVERKAAERALAQAKASGGFVGMMQGRESVISPDVTRPMLDSIVRARGGRGAATAADSAALRVALPALLDRMFGTPAAGRGPERGPEQCHDITVYPAIGLAGGACRGYGMLLDIRDPAHPRRVAAVADSNFSYWHSATFNNDGTKLLFSDEWGGGGAPKCRDTDPKEWGADAIFALEDGQLRFQSYYKLPAPQTSLENCVAHNGSLIPIPGRDVMVQAWYQGGISVFDWTDAKHPVEIAYHDRGPVDATRMGDAGSWSVYWYNGVMVSSEIGRGLDIFELTPSAHISQNEIDAAKSVKLDHLNTQGQPKLVWPPSFALTRAYVDQLERSKGMAAPRIASVRKALSAAERESGAARSAALRKLGGELDGEAMGADAGRILMLAGAVHALASAR
jgi:hypothetical protein